MAIIPFTAYEVSQCMADCNIPEDIQIPLKPDRDLTAQELPELMQRDAKAAQVIARVG
jgi:hypothetical protein